MKINLNADLGESFGPWPMGDDANLLKTVDSANIACGFHAGDPVVMSRTLRAAIDQSVSIGAHPGFADLQGFGRRKMELPAEELTALVQFQLSSIEGMARTAGGKLTHVKPHGALNNMACDDRAMADVITSAVHQYDASLIFLAPALSELEKSARALSMRVAGEVFADRAYTDSGSLVSRSQPGAVLVNTEDCIAHVRNMIKAGGIVTQTGKVLPTTFKSICIHGDNHHAVESAKRIRQTLLDDGHELLALSELEYISG